MPFATGKSGSRGLANCQAKGFPKVKRDVRAIPARLWQTPSWEAGAKGAEGAKDPVVRRTPPQSPG